MSGFLVVDGGGIEPQKLEWQFQLWNHPHSALRTTGNSITQKIFSNKKSSLAGALKFSVEGISQ